MNDHDRSLAAMSVFLEERLKLPLPGSAAHSIMFPLTTGNIRPKYKSAMPGRPVRQGNTGKANRLVPRQPGRQASVLILLYEENGGIYFPLIKRPSYPGVHGGQVSLPGGKAESGEDPVQTALREGEEEIGIDGRKVTAVGLLTSFNVVVSNIFITPVVGIYKGQPEFRPDPREVDRVMIFPVSKLMHQEEILKKEILSSGDLPLIAPHFEAGEEIVWGATAMVLNEFRMVLRGE